MNIELAVAVLLSYGVDITHLSADQINDLARDYLVPAHAVGGA